MAGRYIHAAFLICSIQLLNNCAATSYPLSAADDDRSPAIVEQVFEPAHSARPSVETKPLATLSVHPQSHPITAEYLQNLRSCLQAHAWTCKRSDLSSADLEKVIEADRARNYAACLAGYAACRQSELAANELNIVAAADSQRNLRACLSGYANCRTDILTAQDRDRVRESSRARNVSACVTGYASCRRDELSDSEKATVLENDRARNLFSCVSGYASCRVEQLEPSEKLRVEEAAYRRNFASCLSGLSCRRQDLNDADRAAVDAKRQSVTSIPTISAPRTGSSAGCAENGSCYGDVSTPTGGAKTVHVRGYFRRNGTYVRSHYRSRGRR